MIFVHAPFKSFEGGRIVYAIGGCYIGCGKTSSGSLSLALALVRSHPLQHLIDVRDRRIRLYAMAEIEYEPALAEVRQHVIDRLIESGGACDQRKRIKVSLHSHAVLYAV